MLASRAQYFKGVNKSYLLFTQTPSFQQFNSKLHSHSFNQFRFGTSHPSPTHSSQSQSQSQSLPQSSIWRFCKLKKEVNVTRISFRCLSTKNDLKSNDLWDNPTAAAAAAEEEKIKQNSNSNRIRAFLKKFFSLLFKSIPMVLVLGTSYWIIRSYLVEKVADEFINNQNDLKEFMHRAHLTSKDFKVIYKKALAEASAVKDDKGIIEYHMDVNIFSRILQQAVNKARFQRDQIYAQKIKHARDIIKNMDGTLKDAESLGLPSQELMYITEDREIKYTDWETIHLFSKLKPTLNGQTFKLKHLLIASSILIDDYHLDPALQNNIQDNTNKDNNNNNDDNNANNKNNETNNSDKPDSKASEAQKLGFYPQKRLQRLSHRRLQIAFTSMDQDRDGLINFTELSEMLDILMDIGHFDASTLVKMNKLFPPKFARKAGEDLANQYFNHQYLLKRIQSSKESKEEENDKDKYPALLPHPLKEPMLPSENKKPVTSSHSSHLINQSEFINLTRLFSMTYYMNHSLVWYLDNISKEGVELSWWKKTKRAAYTAYLILQLDPYYFVTKNTNYNI